MAARDYPNQLALLHELDGYGIRVSGQVIASEPATHGGYRTTVTTSQLSQRTRTYDVAVNLHLYTDRLFIPGSEVKGVGTFQAQGSYYSIKGTLHITKDAPVQPRIFFLKNKLRATAIERVGPDAAGLVLGMAYGDDTPLTESAVDALRASGLTHLTAVSGSNITLIFVLAYRLFQRFSFPRLLLITAGLCSTALYASIVGPDGSVLRAWTMGTLGALGLLLGHGTYRITLLSSCLIGLLFITPELATHYGFVLSIIATASLVLLAPALTRLLCHFLPLLCAELLALPLAASLWCSPVILLLSGSLYPYTVLANLLVSPLVAPVTLAGLGALIASGTYCLEGVTGFFLECGALAAQAIHWVSRWCYSLPGSRIPWEAGPFSLFLTSSAVAALSIVITVADRRLNTPTAPRIPALYAVSERNKE